MICISSHDWNSLLKHLDAALTTLSDLKFTVNMKKCAFVCSEIKYLSHVIGVERHHLDPEKLQAIEIIKASKANIALKSAFGLFNNYPHYVIKYAQIA